MSRRVTPPPPALILDYLPKGDLVRYGHYRSLPDDPVSLLGTGIHCLPPPGLPARTLPWRTSPPHPPDLSVPATLPSSSQLPPVPTPRWLHLLMSTTYLGSLSPAWEHAPCGVPHSTSSQHQLGRRMLEEWPRVRVPRHQGPPEIQSSCPWILC